MMMAAVGASQVVVGAQGDRHADSAGLVADGGMHGTADLAGLGQFEQRFLDPANQDHLAVHAKQDVVRQYDRLYIFACIDREDTRAECRNRGSRLCIHHSPFEYPYHPVSVNSFYDQYYKNSLPILDDISRWIKPRSYHFATFARWMPEL